MELKYCKNCNKDLPATNEFFASRSDRREIKLQNICKKCQAIYRKKHYELNKEKYIKKAKEYSNKISEWLIEEKKKLKCNNCDENRYWVLDFHHIDSSTKEESISNLVNKGNKSKLIQEMEKCIILCSNCHRDLHFKEKQADKVL